MFKLIAHSLIVNAGKILIIKRSEFKKSGAKRYLGGLWDFPGGTVEEMEFPRDAAIRETKEEVNLDVLLSNVIYESSELDSRKNAIFTTLVYSGTCANINVVLSSEHTNFLWVSVKDIIEKELECVPYVLPSIYALMRGEDENDRKC